jgi:DNA-binding MarR family transcriptional regulator
MLKELGLTYPQYLVMMVLWEDKTTNVTSLGERLYLNSNTLTPLLKRLESSGLITRQRNSLDERIVTLSLTAAGSDLKLVAKCLLSDLVPNTVEKQQAMCDLKLRLDEFIEDLDNEEQRKPV